MENEKMRFKTCTKAELVAMVANVPDDALIAMRVPTGDYWGTVQACPIRGIDEEHAIKSDRIGGYKLLEYSEVENCDESDNPINVYVLR